MAIYTSFLKRGFYSDITGLPVLFEMDQCKNWKNPPIGFALDVYSYIFAKRANAKILRFPVKLNLGNMVRALGIQDYSQRLKCLNITLKK